MTLPESHIFEFGEFRLDAAERTLTRHGRPVPLTPRAFDTLLYLVRHRGTLVAKEEMMRAIWPDAIVEENNLNQNISTLRRVFGETRGDSRYIVTVPGRGYRFAGEVRMSASAAEPKTAIPSGMKATAVLPFVNMSADPENEYFCEAMNLRPA